MGLLKLLLNVNNAKGIREAMRISYSKNRKTALERGEQFPHQTGLLGAMFSRLVVNNQPAEGLGMAEAAPFTLIEDEEVACEALAEYAVYLERTVDTKLAGLKETMNVAVRRADENHAAFVLLSLLPDVERRPWFDLLDPANQNRVRTLLKKHRPDSPGEESRIIPCRQCGQRLSVERRAVQNGCHIRCPKCGYVSTSLDAGAADTPQHPLGVHSRWYLGGAAIL